MDNATTEAPARKTAAKKAAPPANVDTITVEAFFAEPEDTKRFRKYHKVGDPDTAMVDSFYLSRAAAEKLGNPERIRVTVEAV